MKCSACAGFRKSTRGAAGGTARPGRDPRAARRSPSSLRSAIDEDFRFHQAIAEATRNPQFARFLGFLGCFLIPRQSIRVGLQRPQDLKAYLQHIQAEHRRIFEAIRDRDALGAQRAMRRHLMGNRRRYQGLANAARPPRP